MTRARTPCSASDALGWLCEPVSASIYLSIYLYIYLYIYLQSYSGIKKTEISTFAVVSY